MYKAIFFDRDGTLTNSNPDKLLWRDKLMFEWSGKPFCLTYEKMSALFKKALGRRPWYKNVDDERDFFLRYYYYLLLEEGVNECLEERSNLLFKELWCNNDRVLFSETIEVLDYFKGKGFKMGVISDTSPSLQLTLEQLDIAKYFTSFTASSLVGAGKPSPIIFNAALNAQGVTAEESIFVDDTKVEAEGARDQGFTSFWLDRSGSSACVQWTIKDLKELVKFVDNN